VKHNYCDELDKVLIKLKYYLIDDYNFPYEVSAEIKSVFRKHKFYTTLDNINKKRDEIESIVRYETITMIEKLKEEIDIDFHTYGETTNRELAKFIDELQSEFTKYRETTTH
jgi:archaellum component FlaC